MPALPRSARLRRALGVPALVTAALAALTGCGLQPTTASVPDAAPGSIKPLDLPAGARLTVTSKNFTEQLILGKIAVIAARAAGFQVTDQTNVPSSVPARELMTSHSADMTWAYTGTAWLSYLGEAKGTPDQRAQYEAVRDADAANGLTWLTPAPLNNTYALAIRSEEAKRLGITKLSQIKDLPVDQRTFCVEAEFNSRSNSLSPPLDAYGIPRGSADGMPDGNVSIFDTGAVYTATDRGTCEFGEVYTTGGRIDKLDLAILQDDLGFFPAYNVAPVLDSATLADYPGLEDVFDRIAPIITDDALREMSLRVDDGGGEPADVAYQFMVDHGFVTAP